MCISIVHHHGVYMAYIKGQIDHHSAKRWEKLKKRNKQKTNSFAKCCFVYSINHSLKKKRWVGDGKEKKIPESGEKIVDHHQSPAATTYARGGKCRENGKNEN